MSFNFAMAPRVRISKITTFAANNNEVSPSSTISVTEGQITTESMSTKKRSAKVALESSNVTQDIEDLWKPPNWERVWNSILTMRAMAGMDPLYDVGYNEHVETTIRAKQHRYQVLICYMLSCQTKDQVTGDAMERLEQHGLTVDNIISTSDEILGELIYPVGLWLKKVHRIKETSRILKSQYNYDIPSTYEGLLALPGVGQNVANLTMSSAWGKTVGISVDNHMHRIVNRLQWTPSPTKTREQTRASLEKWLPKELWFKINISLVGFGQTICQPVYPKCRDCLISDICPYAKNATATNKESNVKRKKSK